MALALSWSPIFKGLFTVRFSTTRSAPVERAPALSTVVSMLVAGKSWVVTKKSVRPIWVPATN